MTELIEHVAELTGFRDRELLDVAVVRAVNDVLRPLSVAVYRCVGEPGDQHWLTRARMGAGDPAVSADPLWTSLAALPGLAAAAARRDCLLSGDVTTAGERPQTTSFPISTEREIVGVLDIRTAEPLTPEGRAMVGTVLRIYGNFHDLLDHSERDPLTGLLNRQTFDATFLARAHMGAGEPGRRAASDESAVWLGVVDIDHFKRVNDTHGHLIGDEVLLLMSRLLRSSFRYHDRLYRFGGEEFVVLLDCLDSRNAAQAFERLRSNVERFAFPQVGHVTVSVGFTRTTGADAPSAAFSRADKALYHAKEHGRNQVTHYEALVEAGVIVEKSADGGVELF
ncbi:MAG TPA: GGDEF domain-containing protein [Burkholderiaceae bacterium]|nr:GGDEF domain-containing protein [Burkholderiaceae bacterium]